MTDPDGNPHCITKVTVNALIISSNYLKISTSYQYVHSARSIWAELCQSHIISVIKQTHLIQRIKRVSLYQADRKNTWNIKWKMQIRSYGNKFSTRGLEPIGKKKHSFYHFQFQVGIFLRGKRHRVCNLSQARCWISPNTSPWPSRLPCLSRRRRNSLWRARHM